MVPDKTPHSIEPSESPDKERAGGEGSRIDPAGTALGRIVWDGFLRVAAWNAAAEEIFGWPAEEAKGRPASEVIGLRGAERLRTRLLSEADEASTSVTENADRLGRRMTCEWYDTPLTDQSGRASGVLSLVRNVTERKKLETELSESRQFLQTIIETEPECVKLVDRDGTLIMMNRAGLDMIQAASMDRVKGKSIYTLVVPEHREAFKALTEEVFEGKSGTLAFEMTGIKGRRLWLETHAVPIRNDQGEIIALLAITRDISERKRLEEQLRQSQKMECLGTLSGGIAHDFNNILTAIIGYANLLHMKLGREDPLRHNVERILASANSAAGLTQGLLAYSRKQVLHPQPVDLNTIVRNVERLLLRIIGEDVELKTLLADQGATVLADPGQIEQVLMNLAINARDAMPNGGRLYLETGVADIDAATARTYDFPKPGRYGLAAVTDSGMGMDPETRERIFEPFFTTKDVGKGTGLGLSIVYGIIKQHDGAIHVYSEEGRGTTIKIYLPEAGSTQPQSGLATPLPVEGGSETILVAEDDEAVRHLTCTVLKQAGYHVIEAVDGEDAVNKFMAHRDSIRLLLLDVIMPKKNGGEAYDKIRIFEPEIKALFISGYTADTIHQRGLLHADLDLLLKPVPMNELLRKMRAILDRR